MKIREEYRPRGECSLTAYGLSPQDLRDIDFLSPYAYSTWVDFESDASPYRMAFNTPTQIEEVYYAHHTDKISSIIDKPHIMLLGECDRDDFEVVDKYVMEMAGGISLGGPSYETKEHISRQHHGTWIEHRILLPNSPSLAEISHYVDDYIKKRFKSVEIPLVALEHMPAAHYEKEIRPKIEKYIDGPDGSGYNNYMNQIIPFTKRIYGGRK